MFLVTWYLDTTEPRQTMCINTYVSQEFVISREHHEAMC